MSCCRLNRYLSGVFTAIALLLAWLPAHADYRDMRNVAPANYRETPEGKLAAAKAYAERFLAEDARPDEVFFSREVSFPMWKDQPDGDCAVKAIARAIKPQQPYFEDSRKKVVVIPVWVELLMIEAHKVSWPQVAKKEKSGRNVYECEYERYSFHTKKFEIVPEFSQKNMAELFRDWGGNILAFGDLVRYVALDMDKRYVRFNFRISVEREQPYQLAPQFPKHSMAHDAINKLKKINAESAFLLSKGISDRDSRITGPELEEDLNRMHQQILDRNWRVTRLESSLDQLKNIPSFSEIAP